VDRCWARHPADEVLRWPGWREKAAAALRLSQGHIGIPVPASPARPRSDLSAPGSLRDLLELQDQFARTLRDVPDGTRIHARTDNSDEEPGEDDRVDTSRL
jgi:hypothetical protein